MKDHVKRAAREAAALAKLQDAQAELDRIAAERAERLQYDYELACATFYLMEAIKANGTALGLAERVWNFREQLAPLAASHGVRIVESAVYKDQAVLEYI